MKYWLSNILLFISFTFQAQDTWYEYILGKPNVDYIEAKRTITKEWGLSYNPIISGCIYSEAVQKQIDSFQVVNLPYLSKLDKELGNTWKDVLNEAIQLQIIQQKATGLSWNEPVFGRPNMAYFEQKKSFLTTLGILYQPIFKNCSPNNLNEKDQKELDQSNAFKNKMYTFLGRTWESLIDKYIHLNHYRSQDIPIVWDEYQSTKAASKKLDALYHKTRSEVLRDWGIQHTFHNVGACKYAKLKKDGHIVASQTVEDTLTQRLGSDWKDRVHLQTMIILNKK